MLQLGLSLGLVGQSGGAALPISATVQQYFDRLMTLPTPNRQALYAAMIDGLVADGVWSRLDGLYVFATADAATSLINLVQANFAITIPGPGLPVFTPDRNWQANSSILDTGFNPTTAGGIYAQNDAMVAHWTSTNLGGTGTIQNSTKNAGTQRVEIVEHWSDGHSYLMLNSATEETATAPADTSGFWLINRTASNSQILYQGNTAKITGTGASTLPNGNIQFGLSPGASLTSLAAAIGGSLSNAQRAALQSRLQTYLTAIGAA